MNYSELVNKRDALGGVSPELIQKYKGKSRKELGKLLEKVLAKIKKCRGVDQKADDQLPHSPRRRRSSQGGEMNLWQRRLSGESEERTWRIFITLISVFKPVGETIRYYS